MTDLLQHLSARDLLMLGFLAGVWWSDRRLQRARKDQGVRIGTLEEAIAEVRGLLKGPPHHGDGK